MSQPNYIYREWSNAKRKLFLECCEAAGIAPFLSSEAYFRLNKVLNNFFLNHIFELGITLSYSREEWLSPIGRSGVERYERRAAALALAEKMLELDLVITETESLDRDVIKTTFRIMAFGDPKESGSGLTEQEEIK